MLMEDFCEGETKQSNNGSEAATKTKCVCVIAPVGIILLRESRFQVQFPFEAPLCRVCTLSPWLHGFSLVPIQSLTTVTFGLMEAPNCSSVCVCLG